MKLLAELRRRNVIRMAGLYLVGAWLIVQVVGTVSPMLDTPEWVGRTVLALLAIGFVPALVFSWVFEMTADGLKRDGELSEVESIAPQTARKMQRLFLFLLVVALAFFAFDKFILAPKREASLIAATKDTAVAHAVATLDAERSRLNARSIAVLPFTNMSGDPANEYFSDGISEEILNVLAGTPELQVAARTSSFSFRGKAIEVPEIAEQLNVRMVLEGSVRKQGDKVRITAQLIDASNGFHVWSETYDRDLTDIFAVQDEIAQAIGQTLQLKIGGLDGPRKAGSSTQNLEAYDLYLQGMTLWHTRREQALWDAIAAFERATALDPGFAQAYAGQALAYVVIGGYSNRMPFAETLARARDSAELALVLDPALPEIYAALGQVAAAEDRRSSADALFRRAIALRPSFATAHQWRGTSLMSSGDLANGLASLEQGSALDPRSRVLAQNQSFALRTLGRDEEAKARCEQVFEFAPDYWVCMEDIAMAELALGNLEGAEAMFARQAAIENPSAASQGRELVQALAGKSDKKALAVRYASLPFNSGLVPSSGNLLEDFHLAPLLVMLGEREVALDYLERFASEAANTADWSIMLPAMDPIRCEPRFVAVVKKVGARDPHFSRVCGGVSP